MNDKDMKQIQAQLPQGTKILRTYKAFEGDIRVIVKLPDSNREIRYTVKWDYKNNSPIIELMP